MSADSVASLAAIAAAVPVDRAPGAGARRVGRVLGRAVGQVRDAGHRAVTAVAGIVRPDAEERHWQRCYRAEPYHVAGCAYEDYAPAYRLGYSRFHGGGFRLEDVMADAEREWPHVRGRSCLDWPQAAPAFAAAWQRQDAQGRDPSSAAGAD